MAQTKKKITRKNIDTKSTKQTSAGRKKTAEEVKLQLEVTLIVAFALCVLLFLCNFGLIGAIGNFFSSVMKGFFGITAYIFPILLFGLIIFFLRESGNPSTIKKIRNIASVIFLILSSLGLIELINGISKNLDNYSIKEIYNYGANETRGAGLIAATLDYLMIKSLGKWGTAIIELIVIFVALILLSNGGLVDLIKLSGKRLKDSVENSKEANQQIYIENQEQRKLKQLEKEEKARNKKALQEQIIKNATIDNSDEKNEQDSITIPQLDRHTVNEDKKILKKIKKPLTGVTEDTLILKSNVSPEEAGNMHEITVNGFNEVDLSIDEEIFTDVPDTFSNADTVQPVQQAVNTVNDFSAITNITDPQEELRNEKKIGTPVPHREQNTDRISDRKQTEINKPIANNSVSNNPMKVNPSSNVYVKPSIELLTPNNSLSKGDSQEVLNEVATKLVETLKIFGVDVHVESISKGPTVTRFELQPAPGTKVSKIKGLTDDIKLSLATADIRIEAPVPGKSVIGIEVPNKETIPVLFRDIVESSSFQKETSSNLTFGVGKDIGGNVVVYDIDQFPHLLIAGATGSGKSVCINTLIMSILYKCHPDDVKMIMIDPKVVELRVYDGIPHLLIPVVTDAKKAAGALNAAVVEMMDRYKKFAEVNVRDLKGYNSYCEENKDSIELTNHHKLPRLIIIVDELADLMMVAKNEVEDSICRLAQLARACGIHLIVATQRPSVDVITGLIKANMPSRLAFAVSSGIDSRTILDMVGAEELLGKGDMLFFPKGLKKPIRLQGAFISDNDVNKVVDYLRENCVQDVGTSNEFEAKMEAAQISSAGSKGAGSSAGSDNPEFDELFMDVAYYIIDSNKASIGNLQRKFKIGFNRAARIMDTLAEHGVVSGEDGTKGRNVLMTREEFENYVEENGL